MKKSLLLSISFLAAMALLVSFSIVQAQSWYDLDWEYRKAIIIDADKVTGNLTDFPLLVNVADSDLRANALANGDDILFTGNDGTTKLNHEIESYDDSNGHLVAWVKIPNLSSTVNTVIYLYYGNPDASPQENPTAVWDADYVMVQHLEEESPPNIHNDSTSNNNDGTASVTTQGSATGQINGSDEFDGVDDTVNCGDAGSLDITGSMTVEAWALADGTAAPSRILSKDLVGTPGKFILWKNPGGDLAFIVADDSGTTDPWYRAQGDPVADGTWFHVVGVFDAVNQKVRLYKDGDLVTEVTGPTAIQSSPETVTIGSSDDNDHNWTGKIDEARISSTVRSAEWIKTSYNNQSDPGSFYNVVGSTGPPAVWVDDDYEPGYDNDGHLWGYDAFDNIKDAVESIGSVASTMQSGADRLTALQNNDGGWDWPLDNLDPNSGSAPNTVGPIAMGLAQAYLHTGDPAHLTALQNAGAFLLTKTNNFSPSDGYMAAILDQVLGVSTYTDHVTTYYYDKLAAGTYDRNGLGTLYDTASYVQSIRNYRSGSSANLAAWDIGMGLVGAASVGASTSEWIAGVKAEIDELDSNEYYDVIGLAGAIYGLASVDEDYDPTAGAHAAASSLSDLAAILAGYQIDGGGFTWNANYLNPGEYNETIQETAYSILALNEVSREGYLVEIIGAADYMRNVQLGTGGWENYTGSGENNEITGEGLWGHAVVYQAAGTSSRVIVAPGTYPEVGQIVVDTDMAIIAKNPTDKPLVQPAFNTGDTDDPRGWFLVQPDIKLDVSDITFDGTGHLVWQAFRHKGTGSFTNCVFREIKYQESGSPYAGTAIAVFGGPLNPVDVTGCVFEEIGRVGVLYFGSGASNSVYDNNIYTGKGDGDWLDYALDISNGAVITVQNSTITNCTGVAGIWGSAGVLVTSYYGPGTEALIKNNTITNNTTGIASGYDETDTTVTIAHNNDLSGNDYGVQNTSSTVIVDASANWWGDNTPAGVAAVVDADIDYTPWLHDGTDQSSDPGFQPDLSHMHVDDDSPQTGTAGRIQEAIDLVTGSTVDVEEGTYDDTMNIEGVTGLTVNGVDKTTVIIQPSTTLNWDVGGYGSSRKAAVRMVNSTDVVLQNMTMDFDLIKGNNIFGIFGWDSSVTVDNNILQNMSVDDLSGGYYELCSYFRAPGFTDEARTEITFTGNTFIDTGRVGIVTHDYINATIDGNTFYKTTDDFGYAIEVGSQSTGVVSNNVMYGYDTPAATDGSESAGMYIENAFTGTLFGGPGPQISKNVTVDNNEVYDCQYAMWIGNGYDTFAGNVDINLTLTNNNFHDNVEGGLIIQDEDKADGSSVIVTGSGNTVVDNGTYGYRIFTQGDGDITVSLATETITGHETGIQVDDTAGGSSASYYSVAVNGSIIKDNSDFGVNNTVSSFVVDAENNFWGHPKGPYDPYGTDETDGSTCFDPSTMVNADGLGNDVSDLYVNYCPWSLFQSPDSDTDGVIDGLDNCRNVPNAPLLGTCMEVYNNVFRNAGSTCLNDGECGEEEICDLFQLDLNGVGNGIGDACECIADFDCDTDVDGSDAIAFKTDFGRSDFLDPCTDLDQCHGDFNCDGDVDGSDAALFKTDFGRSMFFNPCPPCTVADWCSYL